MKKRPAAENKAAAEPIELPPRLVEAYRVLASIARQRRAGLLGRPTEPPSLPSSTGHIPPGLEDEDLPPGELPRAGERQISLRDHARMLEHGARDLEKDEPLLREPRDTPDPTV